MTSRFVTVDEGAEDIVFLGSLNFARGATVWGCTFSNAVLACGESGGTLGGVTLTGSSLSAGSNYMIQVCHFSNTTVNLGDRNTIAATTTWGGENNPISIGRGNILYSGSGLRLNVGGSSNQVYNCGIRRLNAWGVANVFTGNTFHFNLSPYECNFIGTNTQITGNRFHSDHLGSVSVEGDSNLFAGNVSYSNEYGLLLDGDGNQLRGNLFGTDPTGLHAGSNRYDGIESRGDDNVIGGTNAADRNVVACSGDNGITVVTGGRCSILGNYVGVNAAGEFIGASGGIGILLWGGSNHVVGGVGGARNVVAAQGEHGIAASVPGAVVENNVVGLTPSGQPLGNGLAGAYDGIRVWASDILVKDNIVCATSNGYGLYFASAHNGIARGNRVGTDASGTNAFGNGLGGIYVVNTTNLLLGGGTAGEGNIIVASRCTTTNNGAGVFFDSSDFDGCRLVGNYIGVGPDGVTAMGNTNYGVMLRACRHVMVGSTNAGERNVISGNGLAGVAIFGGRHNTVQANWIGTSASGLTAVPNGVGIHGQGAVSNDIGGHPISLGNVISGNRGDGLRLYPGSAFNIVRGNFIGVDTNGNTALANGGHGIAMLGAVLADTEYNWIGGTNGGSTFWRDGNVVSGNASNGVHLEYRAEYNYIDGNLIGLDTSGLQAVPNAGHGVQVLEDHNFIGVADGNVIGGNGGDGIRLDAGSGWCDVYGNHVGLTDYGISNAPNAGHGISMVNGSRYNHVGDVRTNGFNCIGANGGDGVYIGDTSYGNSVQGNYIGYAPPYEQSALNAGAGIHLSGTCDNWIGGVTPGEGNIVDGPTGMLYERTTNNYTYDNFIGFDPWQFVVSTALQYGIRVMGGNGDNFGQFNASNVVGAAGVAGLYIGDSLGVRFENAIVGCGRLGGFTFVTNAGDGVVMTNATGCTLSGSRIGGNRTGLVMLNTVSNYIRRCVIGTTNELRFLFGEPGNGGAGILADGAQYDRIGGWYPNFKNTISGNAGPGVVLTNALGVWVQGNHIGLSESGWSGVTNMGHGVWISGGAGVVIGGDWSNRNYIAGNAGDGIHIVDIGAPAMHVVAGNHVGLNISGGMAVPNLGHGVVLRDVAGIVVGGMTQSHANLIGGNAGHGVLATGALSQAHVIAGNYIGASGDGSNAVPNGLSGIVLAGSQGHTLAANLVAGNGGHGILVEGPAASNNMVVGCLVGTRSDGAGALGNGGDGIRIVNAPDNTLTNNIIAGNGGNGVTIGDTGYDDLSVNNRIAANLIGASGTGQIIPNGGSGVCISNAAWNYVGGGNLIGGNLRHGVEVLDIGSHDNFIIANLIGCGPEVTNPVPNVLHGVQLFGGDANRVGRTNSWEANAIAFNGSNGVNVARGVGNAIHGNSIFYNAAMGINLGTAGVSNAEQDGVPNRYQAFPVLTNVFRGSTHVFGDLVTKSNANYVVEFFWSDSVNVSGYGEGQILVDRQVLVTDGAGLAHFELVYPFTLSTGTILTATATDTNGNTSEFTYPPAPILPAPDGDGDGLPDFWETTYAAWGFSPSVWNNPASNADGDSLTDIEEYLADTHPGDSNSFLEVSIRAGSAPDLVFDSSEGRQYPVDYSTGLVSGAWVHRGTWMGTGADVVIPVEDIASAPSAAVRIRAEIP